MDTEQIRAALGKDWHMKTLDVWHRAGYKCEYCAKSLIDNSDDYYYHSQIDHIVPGAGDDIENLALACKACNQLKRNYNFAQDDPQRASIIARAALYIREKRDFNRMRLEEDLKLLRMLCGQDQCSSQFACANLRSCDSQSLAVTPDLATRSPPSLLSPRGN
jgi:hypothetical protein